jgi:hypothetical protein
VRDAPAWHMTYGQERPAADSAFGPCCLHRLPIGIARTFALSVFSPTSESKGNCVVVLPAVFTTQCVYTAHCPADPTPLSSPSSLRRAPIATVTLQHIYIHLAIVY